MSTFSLSGTGVQAIATGIGQLHVHVTTLPGDVGFGRANPSNLYGAGFITPSDGSFYWRPQPIDAVDCWVGLPKGSTQFGYSLLNGTTVDATEVAAENPFVGSTGATGAAGATGATGATGPAGPSGSTGPIATFSADLGSNVSVSAANTWFDVLSHTFAAGTWWVEANIDIHLTGSQTDIEAKLWDGGSNVYRSASQTQRTTTDDCQLVLAALVVLGAPTTLKFSVATNASTADVRSALANNGAGNNATGWIALQLA